MRLKLLIATLLGLFSGPAVAQAVTAPAAAPPIDRSNVLDLDLSTGGRVSILLRPDKAPASVERIKLLTRRGFYDGLTFHRVIEGFMAQTGDPKGDGTGGSELPDLKAEFTDLPHLRGVMSMARSESVDSANSQFFIMLAPNMRLDGKYTPVGRVIAGMAYVDLIARGEPPAEPSRIVKASIAGDNGRPPLAAVPTPQVAKDAAAAAADAANAQAVDAALAADEAAAAAEKGDKTTATERTQAAKVAADAAAQAADEAAEALDAPSGERTPQ